MLKNYFEFRHRFVIFTIVTDANDIKKWIESYQDHRAFEKHENVLW